MSACNADAAAQMWSDAIGMRPGPPRELKRDKRYLMDVTQFKRSRQVVATLVRVGRFGYAWSGSAARQRALATPTGRTRLGWCGASSRSSSPLADPRQARTRRRISAG